MSSPNFSASFSASVAMPPLNDPSVGSASVTYSPPCFALESPRALPESDARVSLRFVCAQRAAHHAAVVLFPFHQVRKCAVHSYLPGVTKKNRRNKRINQIVQSFLPEFSFDEFRQRLFRGRRFRTLQYFAQQPVFRSPPDQSRRERTTRRKRREVQAAVSQNVALGLRIARHEFAFQVQLAHQVPHRRRKSGALRPSFKHKSVSPHGGDHAAGASGSFQHERFNSQLSQAKRACQTAQTAADYHRFVYVPHNL